MADAQGHGPVREGHEGLGDDVMIDEETLARRRTEEAAAWFTRMDSAHLSNKTVSDYFAWRKDPLNRAAYDEISRISGTARALRDDPEIKAVVAQALSRTPWWREVATAMRARRATYLAGGALAAGVLAVVLAVLTQGGQHYSTAVGQQLTVDLADGSKARLNTDSRLRVRFLKGERRLYLERGQAFFDVAHDAARPFIVDAGRAEVRAIGTRFDVRRASEDVEVTLTQGRVRVTPSGTPAKGWTLYPGQGIRVDRDLAKAAPAPIDVETATAWTSRRILLRDVPLDQAVAEVNRYSRLKVALGPGAPRQAKVNGAFDTGDVEGFVAGASDSLGLTVQRKGDGVLELRGRGGSE
jgi:transmembrane sensor